MTKSCDLFTTDRPYATLYDAIFTKRVVNKYGSVCPCYRPFFYGILHMWARKDEEHNNKEKMFTFQT